MSEAGLGHALRSIDARLTTERHAAGRTNGEDNGRRNLPKPGMQTLRGRGGRAAKRGASETPAIRSHAANRPHAHALHDEGGDKDMAKKVAKKPAKKAGKKR